MRNVILASSALGLSLVWSPVSATPGDRAEIDDFKSEVNLLRKQVEMLTRRVTRVQAATVARGKLARVADASGKATNLRDLVGSRVTPSDIPAAAQPPSPAVQETTALPSRLSPAPAAPGAPHRYFDRKTGESLTFYVPSGEITGYGNPSTPIMPL